MTQSLTDREVRLLTASRAGRLVFASAAAAEVALPAVVTTLVLPSVVVSGLPPVLTINRVIAAVVWRKQVDSSGLANAIDGAQQIQVRSDAPGTFRDAISLADNALATLANATEGGVMFFGDSNILVEVVGEDTYEFQWQNAKVDGASLTLTDFQCYLIIEHS